MIPEYISDENFKDHVYRNYAKALSGNTFFSYPPEILSAAIDIEKTSNF